MTRKVTVAVNDRRFKSLFSDWVDEVNSKRQSRKSYSDFTRLRDLFKDGKCPRCGQISHRYELDEDGDLYCSECKNFILSIMPEYIKEGLQDLYNTILNGSDYDDEDACEEEECEEPVMAAVRTPVRNRNTGERARNPLVTAMKKLEEEAVIASFTAELTNKNIDINEGGNNMINVNSMFKGFQIGPVQGDAFRISPMGTAYKSKDGYVVYNTLKGEVTDVTGMVFDMPNMVFALPVAQKKVKVDDVILHNGEAVVVKAINDNSLTVVYPFASEIKEIMPVRNMFGFNFYTKITALMDMSKLGANEDSPFGNLMPMMMMSQMGNGGQGMNPMMMMAMMGGMFGDKADGESTGFPKEMMMAMMFSGMGQAQGNTLQPGTPNQMQDVMAMAMLGNSNLF